MKRSRFEEITALCSRFSNVSSSVAAGLSPLSPQHDALEDGGFVRNTHLAWGRRTLAGDIVLELQAELAWVYREWIHPTALARAGRAHGARVTRRLRASRRAYCDRLCGRPCGFLRRGKRLEAQHTLVSGVA